MKGTAGGSRRGLEDCHGYYYLYGREGRVKRRKKRSAGGEERRGKEKRGERKVNIRGSLKVLARVHALVF